MAVALAYLGYAGFKDLLLPNYKVSQVLDQKSSIVGKTVRVTGVVDAASVEQTPGALILKFAVDGDGLSLPVVYRGPVPDSFKAGGDIVVEGSLDPTGTFQASTLVPKCPSKYEAQ